MAGPFIPFMGGKRKHIVLDLLTQLVQDNITTYIETMVGAGAPFFALEPILTSREIKTILLDADDELIDLYEAARDAPERLWRSMLLEAAPFFGATQGACKEYYYALRDDYNARKKRPTGVQLVLRHAAFNGQFRRNKSGEMNSPAGDKLSTLSLPSRDELAEVGRALEGKTLRADDFRELDPDTVGPGTLIYCDPPYDGPPTAYREYTAAGFTEMDQRRVVDCCAHWSARGATVVYSNADTPFVHALLHAFWPGARVERVVARRSNAADGSRRQDALEVIAHNVPRRLADAS